MLDDLHKRQVAAFVQQLDISGCHIAVNALAAQNFALIIHEFVTNAAKYGALSTPEGRVHIEGRVDTEVNHFIFSWPERGGPMIASPTRKGFGTVILTEAARQLANDVSLDYSSHGFRYVLRLSLERIEHAPPRPVPLSASCHIGIAPTEFAYAQ